MIRWLLDVCSALAADGGTRVQRRWAAVRRAWLLSVCCVLAAVGGVSAQSARPDASSAERRARLLFDAIVHDDPALAAGVFFPRSAFLQVKAIRDPGRYFDQLHARFATDIHALHRQLPGMADARFERFELVKRGGFVKVGEEGNRLPYWASRHSLLHYTSQGKSHQFEVRVLITWEDEWYVIHLSEFH